MGKTLVLDTPGQIEAYRLLATYHGLRMEIAAQRRGWPPTVAHTRGLALRSARRILKERQGQHVRTRAQAVEKMELLCIELGLIGPERKQDASD